MHPLHRIDLAPYRLPDEFAQILSPSLVVFLDRVRENLTRMRESLGGDLDRWRPHVKTTKIPEVWAEMARFGLRNFKCATTREAAVLCEVLEAEGVAGADLLIAYPLLGPALGHAGAIAERHPSVRVSVLAEDPGLVDRIPDALSVFVDVNPGMHRTGVPAADRATIRAVAQAAGERFRGVHFYDGHLYDGDQASRSVRAAAVYEELLELREELEGDGIAVEELITSGTPTFRHALEFAAFRELAGTRHRVSPGTVVFHDARSAELPEVDLVPAAAVFTRVVSHPAPDRITVDAGSKAIAAEVGDPCAIALGHPELRACAPSEEHLPFVVDGGSRPARGEGLLLVPFHVCPTVNLADEVVLVDGGRVVDVVAVRARGHEVRVR